MATVSRGGETASRAGSGQPSVLAQPAAVRPSAERRPSPRSASTRTRRRAGALSPGGEQRAPDRAGPFFTPSRASHLADGERASNDGWLAKAVIAAEGISMA